MTAGQSCAIAVAIAVCLISIASSARVDSNVRLAFHNNGYPPDIGVQVWVDDAFEDKVTRATCTVDHCETTPMVMKRGRHRIRVRVLIGDQASPYTETTIER
jgi:hypothetical protein